MKVAAWNIKEGGFDGYDYKGTSPERFEQIQQGVHKIGAQVCALVDTFAWNTLYGDEELQELFDCEFAINIPLEDDEVRKEGSERQIGVTMLSNLPVISAEPVRMSNRNAAYIRVVPPREDPIDVYGVYLDHASEDRRLEQISTLFDKIQNPKRTVVMGDFNSLKRGERFTRDTVTSVLGHSALRKSGILPLGISEILATISDMRRGEVLDQAQEFGLMDAATELTPTTPTRLHKLWAVAPRLRLDYILHSPDLTAHNYRVLDDRSYHSASDHLPVVADVFSKQDTVQYPR